MRAEQCGLSNPHPEHYWDTEDRTHLRHWCPGRHVMEGR